ncbi:alpha/beta hydrolase [Acuticoccus sp. MNP-M23]|uniref:alpha/beta fold hydrolase n=1 Tax=Acuticoccus sp. MNP-M23 TaxID=3072793 RepID=UPI002815926B|nr:alpha/beta hydrolase [Acuticoccus sp. MNP-M23]WMS41125.1 alpha/beta hydrolase [Acuticoccus sp. MNP-M23]
MRLTVRTPRLDIAVECAGPEDGTPIFLLHGWPDAPATWNRVLPHLHQAGYRTLCPALRGFGDTRFLSNDTPRAGDLEALGQDLIDLVEALGHGPAIAVGHDWGARAVYVASHARPDLFSHAIALSVGWGTNAPGQAMSLPQMQNYWYHWLMATPRGDALVREDRETFTRYLWQSWMPDVPHDEAAFAQAAKAFHNPDWAAIVLHSYRVRWGFTTADPHYDALRSAQAADPTIHVPTLVIHGGADPCNGPATSEGREAMFSGLYARTVLPSVGHFPQREAPAETAAAILGFLS